VAAHTELRRRVDPTHLGPERKRYHWFGARLSREDHAGLGNVSRIDADAVETVGDIDLKRWVRRRKCSELAGARRSVSESTSENV
jgi:hypothetical protein